MKRLVCSGALAILLGLGLTGTSWAQDHGEEEPTAEHAEGAHGEQGEAAHGHDAHINLWEFGKQTSIPLVAMAINFAVLLLILFRLGRKPLTAFLQARHVAIRDALADAQKTRAEAEARFKEYSTRLDHLDRELARLRDEMKTSAQSERDRIVADAEERGARLRREADFLLSQELKQVRKDLERELAVAAVGAAEEVMRKVTTEQDQVRLAESYLEAIGTDSGTKEGSA